MTDSVSLHYRAGLDAEIVYKHNGTVLGRISVLPPCVIHPLSAQRREIIPAGQSTCSTHLLSHRGIIVSPNADRPLLYPPPEIALCLNQLCAGIAHHFQVSLSAAPYPDTIIPSLVYRGCPKCFSSSDLSRTKHNQPTKRVPLKLPNHRFKMLETATAAAAIDRVPPFLTKAARSTSQVWNNLTTVFQYPLKAVQSDVTGFDPKKHLAFISMPKTISMADIKLKDSPLSGFAVSEPFQLFTPQAVENMRQEIFKPDVMDNYKYTSNLAPAQLRGYANEQAPFIYQAWKNPEVLAIISRIAGVELVPCTDFEIGHINLSSTTPMDNDDQSATTLDKLAVQDDKPIVDWHTDSYPFVCVTMLSDCTSMIGGETALRTGDGTIRKVRGPTQGCAVILQGRYIEHQALRAFGGCERVTSVTSFRPQHHSFPDDTVLTTVRPISDLDVLYKQFAEYRFTMLKARLDDQLKVIQSGKEFDVDDVKTFLKEQEDFLAHMNKQIVPKELVKTGVIDDSHLFSEFNGKDYDKLVHAET